MRKTILLSIFCIFAVAINGADYFIYDKPAFMSDETAAALMKGENSLGVNSVDEIMILPNNEMSTDFDYDIYGLYEDETPPQGPPRFLGIVGIKNTKMTERVYLTDGPADIHLSPPEDLIYGNREACINTFKEDCKGNAWRAKYPLSCP